MDKRHTGMGVASFALAVFAMFAVFALIGWAGLEEAATGKEIDENSATMLILGLCLIACWIVQATSIGLGIAGLLEPGAKKVFPILGIVLSGLALVAFVGLSVVGSMIPN